MLKTLQWTLVLLFFSTTWGSCLKDYPKDIPDWLKEKIRVIDKENRGANGCKYDKCRSVDELTDGTYHIFIWHTGSVGPFIDYVYDLEGNELCVVDSESLTESCTDIDHFEDYYFERLIWEENYSGLYTII